jgi:hypothetical protein
MPERSSGRAISERTSLEIALTSASLRAMRTFLSGVEKDAVQALASPVVLASGIGSEFPELVDGEGDGIAEPFTLGKVSKRWEWVISAVLIALPSRYRSASVLDQLTTQLLNNPLPGDVYTSAREVLTAGTQQDWSKRAVSQALSTVLSMDTGSTHRTADAGAPLDETGMNWEARTRMIARTQATATYGYSAVRDMADDPDTSEKRWVAVGDKHTRKSHAKANGQTVPVSEPFMVGGAVMQYPGDSSGPLSETANCRCAVVAV